MQDFHFYFDLGWHYILNWQDYGHILFVFALCGIYTISDWKKVLILIVIFAIGYTTTLALGTFKVFHINTLLTAFLVPVTILITAFSNILNKRPKPKTLRFKYFLALFFGLIHGLAYSNYLKTLSGKAANIAIELAAFNLGIEFGHILIVFGVLLFSFILVMIVKIKRWDWNFFLSAAISGISFIMAVEHLAAIV